MMKSGSKGTLKKKGEFPDSIKQIDWDTMWATQMERASFAGNNSAYWDAIFRSRRESSSMDNYLDELLCRMKLSMDYSVLDVGCGIGEIALPLSRRVSRVTALDYSPVALEMLREKASRLGYVNIKTLHGDFPTFSVGSDVEEHDVVLASRSLPMGDLRKSLTLINQAAKRLCYLTWGTGRNELTEGICSILGGKYFPFPEYMIIMNLLYSIGIKANLDTFIVNERLQFVTAGEAVTRACRGHKIEDKDTQQKAEEYIKSKFLLHNGVYSYQYTTKWALIWWQKE